MKKSEFIKLIKEIKITGCTGFQRDYIEFKNYLLDYLTSNRLQPDYLLFSYNLLSFDIKCRIKLIELLSYSCLLAKLYKNKIIDTPWNEENYFKLFNHFSEYIKLIKQNLDDD